ncbi:MAG: Na+/H+ antiporter subunit G [Planctomycetes bacterium]|jgi:multicomponent Na+:H+ antiporter subunit G|nr:Na+/H+ antiporter subunit G [Planctomycetota bacterium]
MIDEVRWVIVFVFAGLGCLLLLLAAVGLVRMPDLYMRMQVASKASTLGAALVLGAAAIGLDDLPATTRAVMTLVFLCITTPLAAHLLARVAAQTGVPFSRETTPVELPPGTAEPHDQSRSGSG